MSRISLKKEFFYLAISLLIAGGSTIGMFLNYFISNSGWSNIVFVVCVMLLMLNISRNRLPVDQYYSKHLKRIIGLQLLIAIYIYMSEFKFANLNYMFNLFVATLAFTLLLVTIEIDYKHLFIYSYVITIIGSLTAFYAFQNGLITNDSDRILDEMVTTDIVLNNFIVCCVVVGNNARRKKTYVNFLMIASALFDMYILLMSAKRTALVVAVIVFFIVIYKYMRGETSVNEKYKKRISLAFIVVSVFVFLYNYKDLYTDRIDNVLYGLNDMIFGTQTDMTGSAFERYRYRHAALDEIKNFSLLNYIIGNGNMQQIDQPILQSFRDMGIVGLYFFSFYVIYFPLKYIFKSNISNKQEVIVFFVSILSLRNIVSCLNSGNPYSFHKWIPICLLLYVLKCSVANLEKTDTL